MATSCRGRLLAELRESMQNRDPTIRLTVDENNLYKWTAHILGPDDTPYASGEFIININCSPTFPIAPPSVAFKTPIFHPNINFKTGEVCMDVLKTAWSPIWTLSCLCRAIISLLSDPNPDSPLNCDAGNLIRSGDFRGFRSLARMYTLEYAQPRAPIK